MGAKTISVLTTLVCILLVQSPSFMNADETLILRVCQGTPDPGVCTSCLKSDPSSATADEVGLTLISLKCVAVDLDQLFQAAYRYQQDVAEPPLKDALNYCLDRFEDAKAKTDDAAKEIQSKDFGTATGIVSGQVLGQVAACPPYLQTQGLKVPDVVNNVMADVNRDGNIVMAILKSLVR